MLFMQKIFLKDRFGDFFLLFLHRFNASPLVSLETWLEVSILLPFKGK